MKVFATDIDGCIADFDQALISAISVKFDVYPNYEIPAFKVYDRYDCPEAPEIKRWIREELMQEEFIYLQPNPIRENVEVMTQWVFDGWVPSVVTARGLHSALVTELWLAQNHVPYSNLLFAAGGKKGELCKHLNATFLIEDNVREAWDASIHMERVYLLETSGNRDTLKRWKLDLDGVSNIHVVKNYSEIDKLEKQFVN
jgi:hypothetical protein